MPDWSYQTLCRPVLFRLAPAVGRDFCLGFMGKLARLPFGPAVIDFLGHMAPDHRLRRSHHGLDFRAPVGLGPGLDAHAVALAALERFGFGFLEVGPVTWEAAAGQRSVERRADREALVVPEPFFNIDHKAFSERLDDIQLAVPLFVRLGALSGTPPSQATNECRMLMNALHRHARCFSLATASLAHSGSWSHDQWREHVDALVQTASRLSPPCGVFICLPADIAADKVDDLVRPAVEAGAAGVILTGIVRQATGQTLIGRPAYEPVLQQTTTLRQGFPKPVTIIAAGGIHDPEQALQLLEAGADLVQVDTGLVFSGPGLPKRINDAVLAAAVRENSAISALPAAEMSWFWTLLLGAGMLGGGILALVIAATRVVLPYDEVFVNMSRDELRIVNDKLLDFMAHDRMSLSGAMIAVGVFYLCLSWFGVKHGMHWARLAVLSSAFTGFASFFLFLGFGYFDPFHAFVTAILFQLLLLALHSPQMSPRPADRPNLRNDWRWRRSQWGQLFLILHGLALVSAGLVIASIGCTQVFVHEDLEFMNTMPNILAAANPRLIPLIAHDRACLGGMLLASGLILFESSLWGFAQGRRWLWTMFATGCLPAYAAGIGVHYAVGYTHLSHLAPSFAGAALLILGLVFSYPYLCGRDLAHERVWDERRRRSD